MLRLLWYALLLAALGVLAAFFSDHPGAVTIHWMERRVDTSFAFLLLLAGAACALITGVALFVRWLTELPARLKGHRTRAHYRKGLQAVTESLMALATANIPQARKSIAATRKHLGDAPVTLLLSTQAARLEGDDAHTLSLLEELLRHPETKFFAARTLSEFHERQNRSAAAVAYAQQAHSLNPQDAQALKLLVSSHTRLGRWQEALQAIDNVRLPRHERARLKGVIYLRKAESLAAEDAVAAAAFAEQAAKQLRGFAPAAVLQAELLKKSGNHAAALGALRKAWKQRPHPELAEEFFRVTHGLHEQRVLKLAQKMAALQPEHPESRLLVARAALDAKTWMLARRELKAALAVRETAHAARLMSRLEKEEYRDGESAAGWAARAAAAKTEAGWRCADCAHTEPRWHAHCPHCGSFDRLSWQD